MIHPLAGKWRIVEMELWDREFIDLLGPGLIRFDDQGGGEFCFGAVTGTLDCSYAKASIHFTWEGNDEMDEASGYGNAELQDDGSLNGEISFHHGDESSFIASRPTMSPRSSPSRAMTRSSWSFSCKRLLKKAREIASPKGSSRSGRDSESGKLAAASIHAGA